MDFNTILDIYALIAEGSEQISNRKQMLSIRKKAFESSKMIKVAFDTRKINEEEDYNPRRGLQNYHRSDPFVSEAMLSKMKSFAKLLSVLESIKQDFGKTAEWHDSYSRVLLNSVERGLRIIQKDAGFTENQPAIGSLDYLDELLYVRYRLTTEALETLTPEQIKTAILSKDEFLTTNGFTRDIKPSDVNKFSYENMIDKIILNSTATSQTVPNSNNYEMMEKMFVNMAQLMTKIKPDLTSQLFDVKAGSERTVTIHIKDNSLNQTPEEDVKEPQN